jgi:hypothetical protein
MIAQLQGISFVLHTGIAWRHLPLELGFGPGPKFPCRGVRSRPCRQLGGKVSRN